MANGALIFTWGNSVRGREGKSLEVFGKALAYYDELAKEGRIHGHREYFALTGNAGERAGTMVVEGELDELLKLQAEEQSQRLLGEAGLICENFNVQICQAADDEAVGRFVSVLGDMGLT
jgi:hypothetical protein